MKIFFVTILILGFSMICFAQTNNKSENFRLIQTQPSAYISFEKFGKTDVLKGESKEVIWLRFHNNTKWNLTVDTEDGCPNIQECSLMYSIRRLPSYEDKIKLSDIPRVYNHVFVTTKVSSGKSIIFSIPKEHLAEGLYILIYFNYEWESTDTGNISHQISFDSTLLPKEKTK